MTSFFTEYEVGERLRELEALDRRLERWGWFRGHEMESAPAGWRFRIGRALIHLGCWLQGTEALKASGNSGEP